MSKIPRDLVVVAQRPQSEACALLVAACRGRGLHTHACRAHAVPPRGGQDAPTLALCRLPSGTPGSTLSMLAGREHEGQAFINRPTALRREHDKWEALAQHRAHGEPEPPTVSETRDARADLDALSGERFVVKPLTGAAGRGVTMGLSREHAIRCAEAFAEASGPALVQPRLGDGADRRLFIVAGEVVAAMERRPTTEGARASLAYGGTARPWNPSPHQIALALRSTELLGLDIAGVDLLSETGTDLVLEVNACPGLKGIQAATGLDVADRIARLAVDRLQALARQPSND